MEISVTCTCTGLEKTVGWIKRKISEKQQQQKKKTMTKWEINAQNKENQSAN